MGVNQNSHVERLRIRTFPARLSNGAWAMRIIGRPLEWIADLMKLIIEILSILPE